MVARAVALSTRAVTCTTPVSRASKTARATPPARGDLGRRDRGILGPLRFDLKGDRDAIHRLPVRVLHPYTHLRHGREPLSKYRTVNTEPDNRSRSLHGKEIASRDRRSHELGSACRDAAGEPKTQQGEDDRPEERVPGVETFSQLTGCRNNNGVAHGAFLSVRYVFSNRTSTCGQTCLW